MKADLRIAESNLPESLREIMEIIGQPGTMKLVEQYGGTRIFIPSRVRAQHKLANLLGLEQARRLCHHFGGETLCIARSARAKLQERNREIVRRYDAGEAVRSLAIAYQLTERQIYTILSGNVS